MESAEWDLSFFHGQHHRNEGGPTDEFFFSSWLDYLLSGYKDINLIDALRVFTSLSTGDETDITDYDEDLTLWLKGLAVLHSIISSKGTVLAPHELLRTVMDSYYLSDEDHEFLPPSLSTTAFHLPTPVAMFILRSLISTHAIQIAEINTRSSLKHNERIRWRRLKSMVEDTISLFQRMLIEGFENVEDDFENHTQKEHPINTAHFTIASWLYTKHIFPSCRALVCLLLEENHGNGIANLNDGAAATLLGLLTSLLALRASVVSDHCTDFVTAFVNIPSSDEFFWYIRSFGQDSKLFDSGLSWEEDLLLYERPFYNKLGQAKFALSRLQAQLHPSIDVALPSPLSAEYRWALLFPHVITFLADDDLSHVIMGFHLLQMLIVDQPFVKPAHWCTTSSINKAVQRAHSLDLLVYTVYTLLSIVLKLSALEASAPNSSPILEYSSLQVMALAQTLLKLYDTNVQVQAMAELSQKMTNSDQGLIALLPKVLDWLRSVITNICNKSNYNSQDLILLCEVIKVNGPILISLEDVFDDSAILPRNIQPFFSMIEAYTTLFLTFRTMKIFRLSSSSMASKNSEECARLLFISEWIKKSAVKLSLFKKRLEKLIDFWLDDSSSPPTGHHRCFLLHYHLQEAMIDIEN